MSATCRTLAILSTVLFCVSGCGDGARIELRVASDDPLTIEQTQAVLYKRLTLATQDPFADLTTDYIADSGKLVFEYARSAPDVESLRFLYETVGAFSIFAAGDESAAWIVNADIEDTGFGRSGDVDQVHLRLYQSSGARLHQLSSANLGVMLTAAVDGQVIIETPLNGPLGRSLKFDVASEGYAKNLSIVLRSGVLPARVTPFEDN